MIPVILIHNGFQDYVNYTINQAANKNKVYLLGDSNPNLSIDNFEFINYNELDHNEYNSFHPNYIHLNTTSYNYELFCFKRWFMLKSFMIKNNLDVVFYIDSDVLLFSNVNEEWLKFNQYEITLLHRTAAVSSFFTLKGITDFCNMLITIYSNKIQYPFKKIESHYRVRQECGLPGGVCDMTLLEFFHYDSGFGGGPGKVGEMMQIIDNSTYDHNINAKDQDFEFINGVKKIKIIDGHPFVFNEKLNKDVKFNSIHFQGNAKHLIKQIYGSCN
jgi:hypothetical protein